MPSINKTGSDLFIERKAIPPMWKKKGMKGEMPQVENLKNEVSGRSRRDFLNGNTLNSQFIRLEQIERLHAIATKGSPNNSIKQQEESVS